MTPEFAKKKIFWKKEKKFFSNIIKGKKCTPKFRCHCGIRVLKLSVFINMPTVLKGLKNFFRKKINALLFFTIKFSDKHYIKLRKLVSSRKLHWYRVTFLTYTILVSFSDILNTDKIKNGITRKEKEKIQKKINSTNKSRNPKKNKDFAENQYISLRRSTFYWQ